MRNAEREIRHFNETQRGAAYSRHCLYDSSERITLCNLTICHKIIYSLFHFQIKDALTWCQPGNEEEGEREEKKGERTQTERRRKWVKGRETGKKFKEAEEEKKEEEARKLKKDMAKASNVECVCFSEVCLI